MRSPHPDIEIVQQVAAQVAIAVENALAFKQIDALKDKLAEEKLYLEEEIRNAFNFEEIVGESPAMKRVLAQVELVAPAGTTVLIPGRDGNRQGSDRASGPQPEPAARAHVR